MAKSKKITPAPVIENTNVSSDDFKFVQLDKHIFDVKFQSKPTTFFKDALRRFVKNKSSVAAGVLIGILAMMAVLVPEINKNNIDLPNPTVRFLPPRWRGFENAGFLDGTIKYDNIIVDYLTDPDEPRPVNYDAAAVVGPMKLKDSYVNYPSPYALGGAFVLRSDRRTVDAGLYSPDFVYNTTRDYRIQIDFHEENATMAVIPEYAIFLDVKYETTYVEIELKELSSEFGTITIEDFSQLVIDNKPATADPWAASFTSRFRIFLKTTQEGDYPSIYMNSFVASNMNNAADTTFDRINFTSGNEVLLRDSTEGLTQYSWRISGSGSKAVYKANIVLADFTYNPYIAVFGDKEMTIGETKLREYINQGLMNYDFAVGPSSFEILDDSCPVREIISQRITTGPGGISARNVTAVVSNYRLLGYAEMPYFTFGTNHVGADYFKVLFSGLRTSLILGVLVAMINVFNGMIWGSISGYFGGTVDLMMERFTEILGGVPWIVVMTLAILHLGSNFGVFMLALCLTGWIGTSAVTRSQFYRYKRREYVLASRTLGAGDLRLIFRHILPNSIGPIVTGAVLIIPGVIFSEATISYLGLGLQNLPSFGVALSQVQEYLDTSPYLTMSGALIISILMISFNLFGNGLRDAFNPSLKGISE